MLNIVLPLAGIIVGALITAMVGRHYFRRTTEKSLTPFIHLHSSILSNIDSKVRNTLKVFFKDEPVEELTHLQVLIANTGNRAIRDCIKPLTITFPENTPVLDFSILHKHPKESEVHVKRASKTPQNRDTIEVAFPLLNKGDFFLLKFLSKGKFKPTDVDFRITVDELPPKLKSEWLPSSATQKESKIVDWSAVWVGLGFLFVVASLVYVLSILWQVKPSLFPIPWSTYEFSFLNAIAFVFVLLVALLSGFIGILLILGIALSDFFTAHRHRFPLPEDLQPSPRFKVVSLDSEDTEKSADNHENTSSNNKKQKTSNT